jgi:hypothetical protein
MECPASAAPFQAARRLKRLAGHFEIPARSGDFASIGSGTVDGLVKTVIIRRDGDMTGESLRVCRAFECSRQWAARFSPFLDLRTHKGF